MSDRLATAASTSEEMDRVTGDEAIIAAMLRAEAALATAQGATGIIPEPVARAIADACHHADIDAEALRQGIVSSATPVIELVARLRSGAPPHAAHQLHHGATSQDILDTATILVARDALDLTIGAARDAVMAASRLAHEHRETLMVGRTLMQQAGPMTFGLKAAGWSVALADGHDALCRVRAERMCSQLGGAVGTLASFGDRGDDVAAAFAEALGLSMPLLPWHSRRGAIIDVAAALGALAASCDKIAHDVILLAQGEVAEVCEGAPGGSSAMPQKQNPVGSINVRTACHWALALVGPIFGSGAPEHERGAGGWQSEAGMLWRLFSAVHAATRGVATVLGGLRVDAARMEANLRDAPSVMSEALSAALALRCGAETAHAAVAAAVRESSGADDLLARLVKDPAIARCSSVEELRAALDPRRHLGTATSMTDRAVRWSVERVEAGVS